MGVHRDFPKSPYAELVPDHRWFPAAEELRAKSYERLIPPLVARIREEVSEWRHDRYAGATEVSRALLGWWFDRAHPIETAGGLSEFRYYFAQREAVETVIWLYEVRKARVVLLKSGGPKMTVRFIEREEACCSWFESGKVAEQRFPMEMLMATTSPVRSVSLSRS